MYCIHIVHLVYIVSSSFSPEGIMIIVAMKRKTSKGLDSYPVSDV